MPAEATLTLTPTPRLARALVAQRALANRDAGLTAWQPPQVLSTNAWLAQLQQQTLLLSDNNRTPINSQQALHLWHQPIAETVFLGNAQIAQLAQRAWRLIHEYELPAPSQWPALLLSEDNRQFQRWAARYQSLCETKQLMDEWAFAAQLPEQIAKGNLNAPATIELVGFDLPMTPLLRSILQAFAALGTSITPALPTLPSEAANTEMSIPRAFTLQQFIEPEHELLGAAQWARGQLSANGDASIAIVVPDLAGRINQVDRTLRQVLAAASFNLQPVMEPEPWHISLGHPLNQWPLVADALAILALRSNRLSQPQLQQLLRSAFVAGWDTEAQLRSQTLTRLAATAPYWLTGGELERALENAGSTELLAALTSWRGSYRQHQESAWPSQWASRFQTELSSLGFARGRGLSSREYQSLQRWHELLEGFAGLDLVLTEPMSRSAALAEVQQRASQTVFRERNAGAAIEVLGVAEALGSKFDALWISTLDNTTWPGAARRDPLIPGSMQAPIPGATSDTSLQQAQLELAGLLRCAPSVVGSYARGKDEIAIDPTSLLAGAELLVAAAPSLPITAPMDDLADDSLAPPSTENAVRGGTSLLRNQAACPFRAFAQHRLQATDTSPPRPGLSAADRGTLVHQALEVFWREVRSSERLHQLSEAELTGLVEHAVQAGLAKFTARYLLRLSQAAHQLEAKRTERVIQQWLNIEHQREAFAVQDLEANINMQIAGLELQGQIDRVDRLADGRLVLIDYKTGTPSISHWTPQARMKDPQLPAYALTSDPQPTAIAFAQLKPDSLKFRGLAEADVGIPGVQPIAQEGRSFKDWQQWGGLLDSWQQQLEGLANDFNSGQAAVDPREPGVCRHCHLKALCRLYERTADDGPTEANADAEHD